MLESVCKCKNAYYIVYEVRPDNILKRALENLVRKLGKNKGYCFKHDPIFRIHSLRKDRILKPIYKSIEAALNYIDRR